MSDNIPIKNIYYMLSYAFGHLKKIDYKNLANEDFKNIADLFAEILYMGISELLKSGIEREYIEKRENLQTIRGKIDISESIKVRNILKRQLSCSYVEFSINSYMNQILKTTLLLLLKGDIKPERKKKLRKILLYFMDVDTLNPNTIKWNIQYNRNNQTYEMLMGICYLAIKGLLQREANGNMKLIHFSEDQMCRLYENFIFEYYRKEFSDLNVGSSKKIAWGLDEESDQYLPNMVCDVELRYGEKILIIDAKYYSNIMRKKFEKEKIHSGNLYQIFSYVKNKAFNEKDKKVSGMLLYAQTKEALQPNSSYSMSGNKISVKSLDLNCDFKDIKNQLDGIAEEYFFT